ncbi:ATP-binding protein [uncultured Pseudodesulfovibrio sp.]|uniref:two-component system sensor histidine kinase NtrB n=1 Tax=uncultured Pseudodesulfovibrio sp. TaxID=2035858 RepID=UPI0029C77155|nr:ATP-binding protein [uncultured Pseudodesulfovibrio sp.]
MDDFSYENMGFCYWNGALGPFNIGVVGVGNGLKVLVDIIYNELFREFLPEMKLLAVSHEGETETVLRELDGVSCPVYATWAEMLDVHPEINLVVEITGNRSTRTRLRQSLPDRVSLMDHREFVFLCGLHDMALVKSNYMNHLDHQRILLQSITDEIREDIFLLDKKGLITDLNRMVWQRAGVSRKELLGKPCWHAARLRDGSVFCNELDQACPFHATLKSGKKEESLVTRINGNGLLQYYRLYAYPIYDMRGNMTHIMVMHRDITERTHREKFQHQRDKFAIIGEMSTYLAHEIRNPLFAVGGFANSLLKSTNLDEKDREKAQIIVDETQRLDRMLSNMLNFARPTRTKGEDVDIVIVCQDVAELMSVGYGKQGYTIELKASSLPPVKGEADALKQCLVNIIKNSIEAMPDGGSILLDLGLENGEVVLKVVDTGVGMVEQELGKVFNPFYSTKEDGNGLGLAMIKKIVEDFGGAVEIASKPGHGTTVSIRLLPVLDVESDCAVEGAGTSAQSEPDSLSQ